MGLFGNKKENQLNSFLERIYKESFPGGKEEELAQIKELSALLPGHSRDQVGRVLRYTSSLFVTSQDTSVDRIVHNGIMRKPDNPFSKSEAETIYNFVLKKRLAHNLGGEPADDVLDSLSSVLEYAAKMGEDGCDLDEIPEGTGEFGLCASNPVPVKGVPASYKYLESLKHITGVKFTYDRRGSTGAPNIKNPIDIYTVKSPDGKELATIYISPYHKRISRKAPKDFYI